MNKETGDGVVFDKNSMYPAKLMNEEFPWGRPLEFSGRYKYDRDFPLYMQVFTTGFKLKPQKIPSIQIKKSLYFKANEYLESSGDEPVTLSLTKPDLELFLENYDVENIEWHGGYKFMSIRGVFSKYIEKWTNAKISAKKENNYSLYIISKLLLNSLYGRFGLNPISGRKYPILDKDGVVRYKNYELEEREPIYVPVASFVTSYARADIIRSSQIIRDYTLDKYGTDGYIYSDTDSIHCLIKDEDIEDLKKIMDIDDYRLGAWKLESKFKRGKYLRQKCYIEEDYNGRINPVIAGLPKSLAPLINFDNFKEGFTTADFPEDEVKNLGSKLRYKYVDGGVVLVDTDFTIK